MCQLASQPVEGCGERERETEREICRNRKQVTANEPASLIYMYIYVYLHTCTHTYIHTYTASTIFGEKMKDQVEERLSFYDTGKCRSSVRPHALVA